MFSGKTIMQYGAICFRMSDQSERLEILLITSRDTGRWVIPKGWGMRGKDPCDYLKQCCQASSLEDFQHPELPGFSSTTVLGPHRLQGRFVGSIRNKTTPRNIFGYLFEAVSPASMFADRAASTAGAEIGPDIRLQHGRSLRGGEFCQVFG
nr:hypothetical protein [Rhizobium populisoli]